MPPRRPLHESLPQYQQQRLFAPHHLPLTGPRCFRDWLLLCPVPCKHSNLYATCCSPLSHHPTTPRRKDNLAARAQTKLAKKKERREKKLLRAGFEGRKQGFIKPAAKK